MPKRESTIPSIIGLILDPPNELRFKGPFNNDVSLYLKIENPNDKIIVFKIKTTAPKKYTVKPKDGVLEPKGSVQVNILLEAFNYDPAEKNNHKFMIQYFYLNDDETKLSLNNFLNNWDSINASRFLKLKLRSIVEFTENEQERPS